MLLPAFWLGASVKATASKQGLRPSQYMSGEGIESLLRVEFDKGLQMLQQHMPEALPDLQQATSQQSRHDLIRVARPLRHSCT